MKTLLPLLTAISVLSAGFQPSRAQAPRAEPVESPAAPSAQPSTENPKLQTRVFRAPADFLRQGLPPDADPATSPLPSAIDTLKYLGVSFAAPGSTATYSADTSRIVVRNTVEQLDVFESVIYSLLNPNVLTLQGHVHLEVFSLPPLTARKALISHPREADLYAWLNTELEKTDAPVKLEHHSITIVRGGQKGKTEAVGDIPVPSEFTVPQIPQYISLPTTPASTASPDGSAAFSPWPRGPATPVGFQLRNAGHTFEVELTFGDNGQSIDLNIAPEALRRVSIVKWGLLGEIYKPVLQIQRCSAQVSGLSGQPMLVSTFSPPVNTGVPGGNQVDRTWLLFVTVTKPR